MEEHLHPLTKLRITCSRGVANDGNGTALTYVKRRNRVNDKNLRIFFQGSFFLSFMVTIVCFLYDLTVTVLPI